MKMTYIILIIIIISLGVLYAYKQKLIEKRDKELFEEILNDPRINSREVGEHNGIKYFQYMEAGKTGFRDLDGNIVIKAIYESAEMFSEGHSAIDLDGKWGMIDEDGKYVIEPQYDFLGGLHDGIVAFRQNDLYGFLDGKGNILIEPKFHWVDEFAEGLCVVSTDWRIEGKPRLYGYINTRGELEVNYKYQSAEKFENGIGKVQQNNLWGGIDKDGKVVNEIKYKYTNEY